MLPFIPTAPAADRRLSYGVG